MPENTDMMTKEIMKTVNGHINNIYDDFNILKKEMLEYIEEKEVIIAREWGIGESLEELINANEMPIIWHEIRED